MDIKDSKELMDNPLFCLHGFAAVEACVKDAKLYLADTGHAPMSKRTDKNDNASTENRRQAANGFKPVMRLNNTAGHHMNGFSYSDSKSAPMLLKYPYDLTSKKAHIR